MSQYLPSIVVGIVMAFVGPLLAAWALSHWSADKTCECGGRAPGDEATCPVCGRKRRRR